MWLGDFSNQENGAQGRRVTLSAPELPSIPIVEVAPTGKDFGSISTGSSSAGQIFSIGNSGTADLAVTSIALTGGDSSMFTLNTGDGTAGSCGATPTIPPSGNCTVLASFSPTATGARTTSLRVSSNDSVNPSRDLTLSGTAILPSYSISVSVISGNGFLSCASEVMQGTTATCLISAVTGYHLGSLTDNAQDRLSLVSGTSYALVNVVADHVLVATFVPNPTAPGPPTAVSAAAGTAQATVSFAPPASDGGSVVLDYTVTANPGGRTASGALSPIVVTELSNGTPYSFTVTARNAVGIGPASSASVGVTPASSEHPLLSVSTLGDNSLTNNAVLNVTGTVSAANGVRRLTVNGMEVVVDTAGHFSTAVTLQPGANILQIVVSDNIDQQSVVQRTIYLDIDAPIITITSPADNGITGSASVTVTGSVSESSSVRARVGAGPWQSAEMSTVPGTGGTTFTVVLPLVPGMNTVEVTATDAAGNSSTTTAKRTVSFDNVAPTLSITTPAQDITTAKGSITLAGTVGDNGGIVAVSILHDGRTYAPQVVGGAFSQTLSFDTARTYPVVVTATDAANNSTNSVRNIVFTPYAVSFQAGVGGSINGRSLQGVAEGESATVVTAVAATGYTFINWTGGGGFATTSSNPLTVTGVAGELVITANFAKPPVTAASPMGGVYNFAQHVALSSNVTGSAIYYTVDGSTPVPGSAATALYGGEIVVTATATLRFLAVSPEGLIAPVQTQTYIISPLPITSAQPAGGSFQTSQNVILTTSVSGAAIYYTTDGSTPDGTVGGSKRLYTGAISIPVGSVTTTTTLKYFAKDPITGNREAVKSQNYTILVAPPAPVVTASPAGGLYNQSLNVVLSSSVTAADIYYTTNGTTPDAGSSLYGGPIPITATTTLRYFAQVRGNDPGSLRSQTYSIDTVVPVTSATPAGGTYSSGQRVSLTTSKAATVYFTTDGSNPTWPATGSTQTYFGPVSVAASGTLKYFSRDAAGNTEALQSQGYLINPAALTTTATPPGGLYNAPQLVALATGVTGASIRYTTDGSDPAVSGTAKNYAGAPIPVAATTTLRFSASDGSGSVEATKSQRYAIDPVAPVVVSTSPATGAVGVPLDTAITVTFTKQIAAETLPAASRILGVAASGSLSSDGTVWTVIPSAPLAYGSNYGYTLSGLKDPYGNSVPGTTVGFATEAKPVKTVVSTLSLGLSTNAMVLGSPLTVNGLLSSSGSSTFGLPVTLSITGPDGAVAGISVGCDANGAYSSEIPAALIRQPGRYLLQAFSGSLDGSLAPVSSTPATLRVLPVAGYAVMILGRIASGEGAAEHLKTFTRAKNALLARGFDPNNIKTVMADAGNDHLQDAGDAIVTWAKDKLNEQPAPLQVIMIDHGGPDAFYMQDKSISGVILAGWMNALEGGLNPAALAQTRYIIIGSCDSGSYINDLAAPGRIIITSADVSEPSFRGPLESDGIRSGEYFLDEFYKYLRTGASVRDSFNLAVTDVAVFTRRGGVVAASGDKPLQNPLVSIGGDPVGVHQIPAGSEDDAPDTLYLGTGGNAAFDPTGMLPIEPKASASSVLLDAAHTSYTVVVPARAGLKLWYEVRAPSVIPLLLKNSDQLATTLPRVNMVYDGASGSYRGTYAGFTETGGYDIAIYSQDLAGLESLNSSHLTLYRNRFGNSAPNPFGLVSPASDSTQTSSLTFQWETATDPDSDAVTYTLVIGRNQDMTAPSVVKEGLIDPFAVVSYDDGLLDLAGYYWQVWAIDSYGAITKSVVWKFNTDNTNGGTSFLTGKVTDAATGVGIAGATVTVRNSSATTLANGSYLMSITPGSYTLGVAASGYVSVQFPGLIANAMGIASKGVSLNAVAPTAFKITTVAGEGGYLDCPGAVLSGSSATCSIQPGAGYKLKSVSGCDGTQNGTSYLTGKLSADCTASAVFVPLVVSTLAGDCNGSGLVEIAEVQGAVNMYLGVLAPQGCVNQAKNGQVSIVELQRVLNSFLSP